MLRSLLLLACAVGTLAQIDTADIKTVFTPIPVAKGDDKHKVLASPGIQMSDGSTQNIGFTKLARTGEKFGDGTFGLVTDKDGNAVKMLNSDGMKSDVDTISHSPDFTSIIEKNGKIYSMTHFESPRPGSVYISELEQDDNGVLSVKSTAPVDFSGVGTGGVWIPCAGSVTPWDTHLGSEEYEPDARYFDDPKNADTPVDDLMWQEVGGDGFIRYLGHYGKSSDLTMTKARELGFYPYSYGYGWEAAVQSDGSAKVTKHFAMGRMAFELAYTMPDRRTTYLTDDGTNRMFGMFVASSAGNLGRGELFCAKMTQTSPAGGDASSLKTDIEWVSMGTASNSDFEDKITTTKFTDIYEMADWDDEAKKCPDGFVSSNAGDFGVECLKLKEGMELMASRFETRRYAAQLGCTTEWRKWEGITYNPVDNKVYTALSEMARGTEDNARDGSSTDRYDKGGPNHIKVKPNKCGCVMRMNLPAGSYIVNEMEVLTCGTPISKDADGNTCHLDGIASPDNVAAIPEYNQLIIGEDTSAHVNDVIWAFDLSTAATGLQRIFSTPYGSETTGPYWYPNIGDFSYITAVVQHPYGESDQDKVGDSASTGKAGWVGYMGPLKSVTRISGAASTTPCMLLAVAAASLVAFAARVF